MLDLTEGVLNEFVERTQSLQDDWFARMSELCSYYEERRAEAERRRLADPVYASKRRATKAASSRRAYKPRKKTITVLTVVNGRTICRKVQK